jgi:eukaryotic-like serine/threonine-protein kinase
MRAKEATTGCGNDCSILGSLRKGDTKTRAITPLRAVQEDWSTQVVRLVERGEYRNAELIAHTEFESSRDEHAFLMMVQSSYREGRFFDYIRDIEELPDMMNSPTRTGIELRRLALAVYLDVRQIDSARQLVERCLPEAPDAPDHNLKQASILALDAKYEQAAEKLLALHRRLPDKPAILRRLIAVFEQMRDTGKAAAFLRTYQKIVPDDPWGTAKAEHFRALGLG